MEVKGVCIGEMASRRRISVRFAVLLWPERCDRFLWP